MVASAVRLVDRIRIHFGVIDRARGRQRRRRNRAAVLGVCAATAAAAIAALTDVAGHSSARGDHAAPNRATTAERHLPAGRRETTFRLREPAGVVLLARISAPRGVRAVADATIPGIAGVLITTTRDRFGRNPACSVRGGINVCTEAVEWCPMPQATWSFSVTKWGGPAGDVRVDFIVGPKPHSRASVAA